MRTFATKQPSNQDATHQKPVRANPAPVVRSRRDPLRGMHFPGLTGSAMLQRQPGCACGGGCPRCQESSLQTKLKISEPGDQYEQEADRIADQVMRMPEPSVQRQMEPEEEEGMIQREAISNSIIPTPLQSSSTGQDQPSEVPPIVNEVLNSHGHPLDSATQISMESRFGHDFSQVRVHTDGKAAESAQAVNALAYTVGQSIVFNSGQYAPKTMEGQKLLTHELTHTIQQQSSTDSGLMSRNSPLLQRQIESGSMEEEPVAEEPTVEDQTEGDLDTKEDSTDEMQDRKICCSGEDRTLPQTGFRFNIDSDIQLPEMCTPAKRVCVSIKSHWESPHQAKHFRVSMGIFGNNPLNTRVIVRRFNVGQETQKFDVGKCKNFGLLVEVISPKTSPNLIGDVTVTNC